METGKGDSSTSPFDNAAKSLSMPQLSGPSMLMTARARAPRRARIRQSLAAGLRQGGQRPGEQSPAPSQMERSRSIFPTFIGGPSPCGPVPAAQASSSASVSSVGRSLVVIVAVCAAAAAAIAATSGGPSAAAAAAAASGASLAGPDPEGGEAT